MHPHAFYGHADVFFVEYYSRPAGEKSNKSFQIQQITLLICSICIDLRDLDKIGGTSAIEASFMAFGICTIFLGRQADLTMHSHSRYKGRRMTSDHSDYSVVEISNNARKI